MLFDAPISVDGPTALDDEGVSGVDSEPVTPKSRNLFSLKSKIQIYILFMY